MNWRHFILGFILFAVCNFLKAQVENKNQVTPSIKELIFPGQPETKNNFNLFYEVHLQNDSIPKPSFWYKIIFSKNSNFEFTLFPLNESDHYQLYLYKVEKNEQFCNAIKADRIIPLNDYKYQKKYTNTDQSAKFRESLVHIRPIPVKKGDAIYLEVIATKGNDCGHIFDCRTSDGSLVIKVINDNCSFISPINENTSLALEEREEAIALRFLSDLFCMERKPAIPFTSINLLGVNKTVKQLASFIEYDKKESNHFELIENELPHIENDSNSIIISKGQSISLLDSVLNNRHRLTDSLNLIRSKTIKSTADLNQSTNSTEHHTVYDTNGNKKVSRLQVDKVLFSLLLTDLKTKRELKKEEVKKLYSKYRKVNKKDISKRKIASKNLKQVKGEKKTIEKEIAVTQSKIKTIEQMITKNEYHLQDNFVFNKSTSLESEDVVYKIQIGVYKNKISSEIFNGLSPISEDSYSGGIRYSVGAFPKLIYAKQAKEHVVEVGLIDAFIVAYFRGKRISIPDALKLER